MDLSVCYVSFVLLAVVIAIRKGWVKEALALLFFGLNNSRLDLDTHAIIGREHCGYVIKRHPLWRSWT